MNAWRFQGFSESGDIVYWGKDGEFIHWYRANEHEHVNARIASDDCSGSCTPDVNEPSAQVTMTDIRAMFHEFEMKKKQKTKIGLL